MNERSYDWSLEAAPLDKHTCPCCAERFQQVSGVIHDEKDGDVAQNVAYLAPSVQPRVVKLFLRFMNCRRVKGRAPLVSLILLMDQGAVATLVTTYKRNPLGRAMTREQAHASALRPLIFEVADFIVENDRRVRRFLEKGAAA
jgi:hypothetical protein